MRDSNVERMCWLICFTIWAVCVGCHSSANNSPTLDPRLTGAWQKLGDSRYVHKTTQIEFTSGGKVIENDPIFHEANVGTYSLVSKVLTIWKDDEAHEYTVEFLGDGNLLFEAKSGSEYGSFGDLEGRWERTGNVPSGSTLASAEDIQKLQAKLTSYKSRQQELSNLLYRLEQDKAQLVRRLKSLGVETPVDLKGNSQAEVVATELSELRQQIVSVRGKHDASRTAITRIESLLRRTARQAEVDGTLSGENLAELAEVSELTLELDERLEEETWAVREVQPFEVQRTLEEELR